MSEQHLVVRIQSSVKSLAFRVAAARGEKLSDFVRRAVLTELARLSFLDDEAKKALGIEPAESPRGQALGLRKSKR